MINQMEITDMVERCRGGRAGMAGEMRGRDQSDGKGGR